jgi:hypothetical protein
MTEELLEADTNMAGTTWAHVMVQGPEAAAWKASADIAVLAE